MLSRAAPDVFRRELRAPGLEAYEGLQLDSVSGLHPVPTALHAVDPDSASAFMAAARPAHVKSMPASTLRSSRSQIMDHEDDVEAPRRKEGFDEGRYSDATVATLKALEPSMAHRRLSKVPSF